MQQIITKPTTTTIKTNEASEEKRKEYTTQTPTTSKIINRQTNE